MASAEPTTPLSALDIFALSDVDLADFMAKNRQPGGGYELHVHGWDKLSKDQRDELAERLKAQQRALAESPTACSRPLDLAELDARLRNVSDGHDDSPRAHRRTISPCIDDEALDRLRETEAYFDLLEDAGRPLYPIDLLERVLGSPDAYDEMLRPWKYDFREYESGLNREHVFGRQWKRWTGFRRWQRDNRGIWDESVEGLQAYAERVKREIKPHYTTEQYAKRAAEIDANPEIELPWDSVQRQREMQQYYWREHGCEGFSDYVEAVKRRLKQHGFTRPIQLKEDPKQQDQLTTWIEYLNFEYWWLDRCTRNIERLKPGYDKAWQELVDSKLLRPHETEDYLRTDASPWERESENEAAKNAVQSAKLAAGEVHRLTQQDPNRSRIPKTKRMSMMKTATTRVNAAKAHAEFIKKRSNCITDFIRGTFDIVSAKRDAAHHRILLQWVLDQVPLVEAEMTRSGPSGTKGKKRTVTTDEGHAGTQRSKKQKLKHQESGSPADDSPALPATEQPRTKGPHGIAQPGARGSQKGTSLPAHAPQRPRSARIAARQNDSAAALAPQARRPGLRPRPPAKPKEPPRPQQKAKAKTTKGGCKRNGRGATSKLRAVSKRNRR